MKLTTRFACVVLATAILPGLANAALIDDDLNTAASAANYSEVASGADHQVLFGFDYSGLSGPAPNTTDASTTGVRITANRTVGASSSVTLFHNTPIPANARVTVDMYMGVTGSGGTTEFGSVGLGSTGASTFSIFSPIAGDGTYYTATGEGGSSSDWRWSRPGGTDPTASVPVNNTSGSYLLGGTNAPMYTGVPGLTASGTPENIWVTLSIANFNGTTQISINDQIVVQGDSVGDADDTVLGGMAPGGFSSMSYADVFSSVASPGDSQFGIFDNFRVEFIPEPTSMLLLSLGTIGLSLVRRRR